MTNWIPTTEVAKLIRSYLKKNYPNNKFSVRSDSYAGGSAVRVETPADWSHEMTRELWAELSLWGSAGFDGMTDSSYSKSHWLCPDHGVSYAYVGFYFGHNEESFEPCCEKAENVHLGASYVTVAKNWR